MLLLYCATILQLSTSDLSASCQVALGGGHIHPAQKSRYKKWMDVYLQKF